MHPALRHYYYYSAGEASLVKDSSGLVYSDDFTATTGWTTNAKMSQVTDLTFLQFGYIPGFDFVNSGVGTTDEYGCRQGQVFIDDDGTWYLLYDGAEFPVTIGTVTSTHPWAPKYAVSTNRGRTWTKMGVFGPGADDGAGGTLTYGTAMGQVAKFGSTYYFYRVVLIGAGGGPPYYGDIWTCSSMTGTWVYHSEIPRTAATLTATECLPGNVVEEAGTYHLFFQSNPTQYSLGRMSSAVSPAGPWTLDTNVIYNSTFFTADSANNEPENERVFKHPASGKFVMLFNSYKGSGTIRSDFSWVAVSNSITDWSAASLKRLIQQCAMDGTPAIGVVTHVSTANNTPVVGNNGFIPIYYDGEGTVSSNANPSDFAYKRKVRAAMLEPSGGYFQYTGTDAASYNIFKSVGSTYTDIVAEFAIEFNGDAINRNAGIWLRADGTGNNGYRIVVRTGDDTSLDKFVGGAYTSIAAGTGSRISSQYMPTRVKAQISGTNIKVWIEDELQINVTDASLASGTHTGFFGFGNVTAKIRRLSIHKSDTVTINGLPAGQLVVFRADGKIPAGTATANGSGVATFAFRHYPLETIEINGTDFMPEGGIWGGDTYSYS